MSNVDLEKEFNDFVKEVKNYLKTQTSDGKSAQAFKVLYGKAASVQTKISLQSIHKNRNRDIDKIDLDEKNIIYPPLDIIKDTIKSSKDDPIYIAVKTDVHEGDNDKKRELAETLGHPPTYESFSSKGSFFF